MKRRGIHPFLFWGFYLLFQQACKCSEVKKIELQKPETVNFVEEPEPVPNLHNLQKSPAFLPYDEGQKIRQRLSICATASQHLRKKCDCKRKAVANKKGRTLKLITQAGVKPFKAILKS